MRNSEKIEIRDTTDQDVEESALEVLLKSKPNIKDLKIYVVCVLAILLGLLHLHAGMYGQPHFLIYRSIHVSIITILGIFLKPLDMGFIKKYKYGKLLLCIIDNVMILSIVIVQIYIAYDVDALCLRGGAISMTDVIAGTIYILIVLEATRRWVGPIMVVLAIFFTTQNLIADKLFWIFRGAPTSYTVFIDTLFVRTEGIFGLPIYVVTSFVVLFLIFAAILRRTGAGKFFIDLSLVLTGRYRGGPAKTAIISSALLGMISGSSVANVVGTGSITIPLMKKTGYDKTFAGAVEAVASSGGQVMPPIMGATAFIIAQNLRIPYIYFAFCSFIAAFLYFLSVFVIVDFESIKRGLKGLPTSSIPSLGPVLKKGAHLFIPIAALVYFLVAGYTPARASFMAVMCLIIVSSFRKETRLSVVGLLSSIEKGIKDIISVSLACAVAGMIIGGINFSGLGLRVTFILSEMTKGNMFLLLIVAAFVAIILGMGVTTTAVYITVATLMAAPLLRAGIIPIAAHMFIFYFGVISAITPPIAMAAYAASGISGASPGATGKAATKIGVAGFIIPFMFVYSPELLLQGTPSQIFLAFISACAGVYLIAAAIQGVFLSKIIVRIRYRIVFFCLAILLVYPSLTEVKEIIVLLFFILLVIYFLIGRKRKRKANSEDIVNHYE